MSEVTLGGERLGSGNKQKIQLNNFERSTHDLGYKWRSTMAPGTLVPFMSEVALPGDTFDINLACDVKTHPTIGPLFGSFKVQLDVFQIPIRLYQGKLHMNMLNIGLKMNEIKLPQIRMEAQNIYNGDNSQINPSSIFSHLNIRGLGRDKNNGAETTLYRDFNAIPWLGYWDIYKNYYSNKVEEIGYVIHNNQDIVENPIIHCNIYPDLNDLSFGYGILDENAGNPPQEIIMGYNGGQIITFQNDYEVNPSDISITMFTTNGNITFNLTEIWADIEWSDVTNTLTCKNYILPQSGYEWYFYTYNAQNYPDNGIVKLNQFDLTKIDTMREYILTNVMNPGAFLIDQNINLEPYNLALKKGNSGKYSKLSTQEGLAIKTYQSDLFNNWVSTEWIDGTNGINSITAVDTSSGSFTIDSLQLSTKVYNMLNRIAVSGGTYDDWLDAVYTHERTRGAENPVYMGGLIKEVAFQEVISNAGTTTESTGEQPLGTLAGRGVMTHKHKGGKVYIKVDEPSYILGIVSLTPSELDYSQGNKWDVNLKTMDDLHKPSLDQIGFQDLYTDQLTWWDSELYSGNTLPPTFHSLGKQPAWINYMTNVNRTRGNFAEQSQQMFMTLNRRYEQDALGGLKDGTTYISPTKLNYLFADTRLDAQNFWVQIATDITARRKMSAKLMPNL